MDVVRRTACLVVNAVKVKNWVGPHTQCRLNIGIKHGFSCVNIRQVPWEVLKTEADGRGFQHLPRDPANDSALKNHVRSLLLRKN